MGNKSSQEVSSTPKPLHRQRVLHRTDLIDDSISNYYCGNSEQCPEDIVQEILSKLSLEDFKNLCFVSKSFRMIIHSPFDYTVLCFLDSSKLQPDLTEYQIDSEKCVLPFRFPKIKTIESEQSAMLLETSAMSIRTEPPVRTLVMTRYDMPLPFKVDTSKIDTIILSSDGFTDPNQVYGFLKEYQFPNLRALTYHNLIITKDLADYCSSNDFKLEYLKFSQCTFNFTWYQIWEGTFTHLLELVIVLGHHEKNDFLIYFKLNPRLKKFNFHAPGGMGKCGYKFFAGFCYQLTDVDLICPDLCLGKLFFQLPFLPTLIKFKSNVPPIQTEFEVYKDSYWSSSLTELITHKEGLQWYSTVFGIKVTRTLLNSYLKLKIDTKVKYF
jgi:hypothetical protein